MTKNAPQRYRLRYNFNFQGNVFDPISKYFTDKAMGNQSAPIKELYTSLNEIYNT